MTMQPLTMAVAMTVSVMFTGAQAPAKPAKPAPAASAAHVLLTPGDMKWGPAPPVLPPGAQIAVLDGDPSKPGAFTLRLKLPDGYKIPAHWHPTDEHVTVIQGTFRAGMGDKYDDAALHDFPVGSFLKMPKTMRHFAVAKGEVIVQINGPGPFVVNYVNPADDPSKKASPTTH
ncbi:MAG: cupin domain-containing protein [Acidobacteriota bacterium]